MSSLPRNTIVAPKPSMGWPWGGLAFLLPFGLYASTLAPTVTYEDSGSFLTAAAHLGAAHPPGYPLWCLLAHAFTWLPVGEIAWRVHLCSAFFAALATWLTFRVGLRLTGHVASALLGALSLAVSRILWSQAVIAEVYALNLFFTMLSLDLVLCWTEDRRDRWLYALALTTGLSLTNHFTAAAVALVAAAWILLTDWRRVLAPRVLLTGGALVVLGLSVYAYLPIQAAGRPPIHWGHLDSLEKTFAHISRQRYQQRPQAPAGTTDLGRHVVHSWAGTGGAFGPGFAVLAGIGAVRLVRRRRAAGLATLSIALMDTVVLNGVLRSPADPMSLFAHRVFYLPLHAMAALWVAVACEWLLTASWRRSPGLSRTLTAGLFGLVAATAVWNLPHAQRRGDERARNLGLDVLDSIPPGAGVAGPDDLVGFSIAYLKFVEGKRPDVELLSPYYEGDGEQISALVTTWPLTDAWRDLEPRLAGYDSVPHGLVYLVAEASVVEGLNYASFAALPGAPRGPQEGWPSDPFEEAARSRYAVYHARLGAKFQARGLRAAAERQFERAEALNPGDAYATWVLVEIYRHFRLHSALWAPLLERALREYDEWSSPRLAGFYPVQRDDLMEALDEVRRSSAPR